MGSTVSQSLKIKFASAGKELDSLEDQDINTIYEILIKNFKAKVYAELIYEKAIYDKPEIVFKYAILVKRLERVRNSEGREFHEIFKAHLKKEVQSAVDRSCKNDLELVNKVGFNIARLLGILLVENAINVKSFREILRPAKGKFQNIFSYLSSNSKIRDKLRAEKIMSFEDLFQTTTTEPRR